MHRERGERRIVESRIGEARESRDSQHDEGVGGITRRVFVAGGARALVLTPLAGAALLQVACGSAEESPPTQGTGAGDAGEGTGETAREPAPEAPTPEGAAGSAAESEAPKAETPRASGSPATRLVTEVPAMASLVEQLQYVNESPKADQNCTNCLFYTARMEDRGKCQLFAQGLVTAEGWCASWAAKS